MRLSIFHNLYNLVASDNRKCFSKGISRIITYIKMGIGALYELCAPSTITHFALRITHSYYFLTGSYVSIYISLNSRFPVSVL